MIWALIFLILLIAIFGGFFLWKILWLLIIVALIIMLFDFFARRRTL